MFFKTLFAVAFAAASVSAAAIERSKIDCKKSESVFLTVDIDGMPRFPLSFRSRFDVLVGHLTPLSLAKTDIVFNGGKKPLKIEFQTCTGGTTSDDPYTTYGRLYVPSKKQCIIPLLTDDPTLQIVKCEADEISVWKLSGGEGNEVSFVSLTFSTTSVPWMLRYNFYFHRLAKTPLVAMSGATSPTRLGTLSSRTRTRL